MMTKQQKALSNAARTRFRDDEMAQLSDALKTVITGLEHVMDDTCTMSGFCAEHGISYSAFRKILYSATHLYERPGGKESPCRSKDYRSFYTPEELVYLDVFQCDASDPRAVYSFMPPSIMTARHNLDLCFAEVLTDKEKQIMQMHYDDGMNFEEIAKEMHVSRERIRQRHIRCLKKLSHPLRKDILMYGESVYDEMRRKYEQKKQEKENECLKQIMHDDDIRNLPIEKSEFSVRVRHGLLRHGILTVGDLISTNVEELWKIPHLGKGSIREIERYMHQHIGEQWGS